MMVCEDKKTWMDEETAGIQDGERAIGRTWTEWDLAELVGLCEWVMTDGDECDCEN